MPIMSWHYNKKMQSYIDIHEEMFKTMHAHK